ncbi:hypothetical protein [Nocardioides sp.]|uniref:hypothetical protein n=1 Tax=Nocardioides sp. TaxID=35761 RepID=UPI002B59CFAA|nr:hypothetical protein [Nocardioides sp.]HXH77310.1 hypothetical protein [Nocardioides sp.]
MSEVNEIKAGKYQLVAVQWDQITSKPDEPLDFTRHTHGAIVELSAAEARRLVGAGAVVKPGQLEKSKAERAREIAEQAKAEYEAALASLPEDVRAEVAPETVAPPVPNGTPAKSASKVDWVTYATDEARGEQRLTPEDAEAATRDQLAEKYLAPAPGGGS